MNNCSYRIRLHKYIEGHEPGRYSVGYTKYQTRYDAYSALSTLSALSRAEDPENTEISMSDDLKSVTCRWTDPINDGPSLMKTWDLVLVNDEDGRVIETRV